MLLELSAKLLGRLSGREPHGVEAVLRGRLLGPGGAGARLRLGRNVQFVGPSSRFTIGANVSLSGNTYLNANGPQGSIAIGERTHVDQFCVLYGQGGLRIGARCAIASGVVVYTQSNQYESAPELDVIEQPVVYAPVRMGDDVWIGAGAVILPGVSVGDHAVIGAGAVVRSDVPPWAVVAGVPARFVRDRRHRTASSGPSPTPEPAR